jgi:Flp pilus assembly protein TadD
MMKLHAALLMIFLSACSLPGMGTFDAVEAARARASSAEPQVPEPPPSAPLLIAQGDQMRDAGNYSRAAWSYLRALRVEPALTTPRERIGFLQLTSGDAELAKGAFEMVLRQNPKSPGATLGLGLAHLQLGHLLEARTSLEQALALDPSSTTTLLALGMLCDWSEQHEDARRYYEKAGELQPISQEVENNLGVSYLLTKDYAKAEQHLRRAVDLDRGDLAQHNNLGLALAELGRYDEALAAFRAAGSESAAQNNLGYLRFTKGDYAGAIQHYELALAATPNDPLPIIRNLRRAQDALDRGNAPAIELGSSGAPASSAAPAAPSTPSGALDPASVAPDNAPSAP